MIMNKVVPRKPKIVYIVTAALSLTLFRGQLRYIQEHGLEVIVISSPGKEREAVAASEGVGTLPIPMQREINLPHDVVSLWRLLRTLRQLKPDIVNAATPKAGLLG